MGTEILKKTSKPANEAVTVPPAEMTEVDQEEEVTHKEVKRKPCMGVQEAILSLEETAAFYNDPTYLPRTKEPYLDYVAVRMMNGLDLEDIALVKYSKDARQYIAVNERTFRSKLLGTIKVKPKDMYQTAYADSLAENQLTFATGPAGSGKTLLALGYAFSELERERISKIVIFTNPYIATSAVKLGFLPGSKVDKLLETSIGSILISKLGGEESVRSLIDREKLVLMPMGDCRGYEVPEDSFVYFTEAQNADTYLMKLFLQRTNDTCKICIEGDTLQADSDHFQSDSGLKRAIEVFAGEDYSSHIDLKVIYRGRIAQKAGEM